MQGIDIMAMVQKSSMAKQKSVTASFGSKTTDSSFKSQLAEARKYTASKDTDSKPIDQLRQESTQDNKLEKFAKVMSNNKAVKDTTENASTEETADVQKVMSDEQKPAEVKETETSKVDAKSEETKPDTETALNELVESAEAVLQQLLQLTSSTNANQPDQENAKQIEESIKAISQKLEQMLTQIADIKETGTDVALKDLKVELKELLSQLKTQTNDNANAIAVDKPSLQQTVNTIKQLINKMNEVKPMLQQKLAKPEVISEQAEIITEPQIKQSKIESKVDSSTVETKQSDENAKLNAVSESNQKQSAENDSKENDKEQKYKTDTKEAPKHQIELDKHKPEGFKILNTLPNDKTDAQINLRELNLNQKKEQMTAINKSDIVNQVIKKADIIVREGHSEMVMKLEPESLGKLNLKIVVEKGLITAKFVAESQQVKEVLESSFNQLKDALQEKGIAVQNFSVSVGQQAGDSSSNQSFSQWKQSLKIKNKATGDFIGLDDEQTINQNPYNYHEGKFDYRA